MRCSWCRAEATVFGTLRSCDLHESMLDAVGDDLYSLRIGKDVRPIYGDDEFWTLLDGSIRHAPIDWSRPVEGWLLWA